MQPQPTSTFTIMTYNILIGGKDGRIHATERVIRELAPDVVGVQEANDPAAIRALAKRLGMHVVVGYSTGGYHVALLSRWPIRSWVNHGRPIFQKGLIEAMIDLPGEAQPWHVFVGHLTADFYKGYGAERQRAAEIRAIIECMATARMLGRPHLLMGDFNALAPGETFDASGLLARVIELDRERARTKESLPGQPHLGYIIPPMLHPLLPLVRQIPKSRKLSALFDRAVNWYLPRLAVPHLLRAGYTDCLRATHHLRDIPPTCPLPAPAGRIDYLWTDPILAERLLAAEAVVDGPGLPVNLASDHRPVLAQFTRVPAPLAATEAPTTEDLMAVSRH
ncbi:MAG: endonuclease/exonuclease/phosphatase family protein [Ktedonobacterales bacterium]|nr:endonuclease/exonuclease/phosphatase family protein [Ktedonobacterales bacterium]